MLNYLLDKIAGPKCIELKVQNPEKFSFKPKELLSLTSDIFLKLSAHAAFAPAVIRDGRSYNPQVSRISLNPKPGVFNSRCDHKQELLTSLLFALRRSYNPQVLRKVVRLLSTHSLQDQAWLERLNGAPSSLAPLPRRRPPPSPLFSVQTRRRPRFYRVQTGRGPRFYRVQIGRGPREKSTLLHRFLDPPALVL
jgi:hypothetical protein